MIYTAIEAEKKRGLFDMSVICKIETQESWWQHAVLSEAETGEAKCVSATRLEKNEAPGQTISHWGEIFFPSFVFY